MPWPIIGLALGAASFGLGVYGAVQGAPGVSDDEVRKQGDKQSFASGLDDLRMRVVAHNAQMAATHSTWYAQHHSSFTRGVQAHLAALYDPRFFTRNRGEARGSYTGASNYSELYRYYYDNPVVKYSDGVYTRGQALDDEGNVSGSQRPNRILAPTTQSYQEEYAGEKFGDYPQGR